MDTIDPVTAANLQSLGGVRHAFHTRQGGCSMNPLTYEPTDLDCGLFITQDRQAAEMNRAAVRDFIKAERLLSLKQIHSNLVVSVADKDQAWDEMQEADALVTDQPHIAIGVMSADCGPVLFCDPEAGVIGAAHAGWQGAVGGVLQNTVAAMESLGAKRSNIHAALGPCIQQASYEVGPEFQEKFVGMAADNARFFVPSTKKGKKQTHFMFNLSAYVVAELKGMDLASAISTGHDTCADEERFFSHRRGTLSGKGETMRHISTIALG